MLWQPYIIWDIFLKGLLLGLGVMLEFQHLLKKKLQQPSKYLESNELQIGLQADIY